MGVKGLWQLLGPVGKPVSLESLEGKILAVDVSIWLNKATKGMRDKHGNQVYNAHLVLMFHRICKLLFYGIKPVFVFDGGVPELKKRTLKARKDRRLTAETKRNKTRDTMLKNYLQAKAVEAVTGEKSKIQLKLRDEKEPDLFEIDPVNASSQSDSDSDNAMENEESWLESLRNEHVQDMFDNPDTVDIESKEFQLLSPEIQHELLTEMKDFQRKRHRRKRKRDNDGGAGSSKQDLVYQEKELPENAGDFSNYQLKNLRNRGKITHKIDSLRKEMNNSVASKFLEVYDNDFFQNKTKHLEKHHIESKRMASEDQARYILIKTNSKKENPLFQTSLDSDYSRFKEKEASQDNEEQYQKLQRMPAKFEHIKSDETAPGIGMKFFSDDSSDDESKHRITKMLKDEVEFMSTSDSDREEEGQFIEINKQISIENKTNQLITVDQDSSDSDVVVSKDSLTEKQYKSSLVDQFSSFSENDNIMTKPDNVINDVTAKKTQQEESILTNTEILADKNEHESDETNQNQNPKVMVGNDTKLDALQKIQYSIHAVAVPDKANSSIEPVETVGAPSPTRSINYLDRSNTITTTATSTVSSHVPDIEVSVTKETSIAVEPVQTVDLSTHLPSSKMVILSVPEATTIHMADMESNQQQVVQEVTIVENVVKVPQNAALLQKQLENEQDELRRDTQKQTRLAASLSAEKYKEVQELLHLFGIPYMVSPMEAEAQCAYLDTINLTDGSVTDDSDIFLFGGQTVYKNIFNQKKYAEVYNAKDVEKAMFLTRRLLIALAFLTGSDYTDGISGVGGVSGMEILLEFAQDNPVETLNKLKEWAVSGDKNKKSFNAGSKITQLLMRASLPTNFNSSAVWEAYLEPTVDESNERFEWGTPDVDAIKEFASEKLGWLSTRTEEVLKPVLQKTIKEKKSQKTLKSYFAPRPHLEQTAIKSKRLQRILTLMGNPDDVEEKDGSGNHDQDGDNTVSVKTRSNTGPSENTKPKSRQKYQEETMESKYFQDSSDSSSSPRKHLANKRPRLSDAPLSSTISSNEKVQAKKVENLEKAAKASMSPLPPYVRMKNINAAIQKRLQGNTSGRGRGKRKASKKVAAAYAVLDSLDRPKPLVSSESDSD